MSRKLIFGQHMVSELEFFFTSKSGLTLGLTNLKPIIPGHVLVIPRRRTSRFSELKPKEVSDLWLSAQKIGSLVEKHFNCSSITFAIQDGTQAGQTVDHVHVHVIPRKGGDFTNNDDIWVHIEDDKREARSLELMAKEAEELKQILDDEEKFNFDRATMETEHDDDE